MTASVIPQQTCSKCNISYPATSEFFYNRRTRGELHKRCKKCHQVSIASWARKKRQADPNYFANAKRRHRAASSEQVRQQQRNWRINNPDKVQDDVLRRRFGISYPEYQQMLASQSGVCAICRKPETQRQGSKIRRLAVDHNHTTGKVRQLLCHRCNTGIGWFYDDPGLLAQAIEYLVRHHAEV